MRIETAWAVALLLTTGLVWAILGQEVLAQEYVVPEQQPVGAPDPDVRDTLWTELANLRAETKDLAWKKGDIKIVPYGFLFATSTYETERSAFGDFALFIYSPDDEGEDAFYMDAKTTRFGFNIIGPREARLGDAQLGGAIEFDFQGQYLTRNKGSLLFRKAYIELKNDQYLLLFGQSWEVISPLYPGSINYVPGNAAGNIGYRRAMLRYDRYLECSDTCLLTLQSSLNVSIAPEFASDPTIRADTSGWPVVEGRMAWTLGERSGPCARPITFGVSGHIGENTYDILPPNPNPIDDLERRTWSLNADLRLPITRKMAIQAEFFTGENLAASLGGILQGVDRGTRRAVRSTGGWIDLRYDWTRRLYSYTGFTIDDPVDSDLSTGRTYNTSYFANINYKATDNLLLSSEVSGWKTGWVGKRPGDSVRLELQARYSF